VFLFITIFLTPEECQQIIAIGESDVSRSKVVSNTEKGKESKSRTSSGVFFVTKYMKASALLRDIERRIAEWTQLPVENGEAYYLLRYELGQEYKPHTDWFGDTEVGRAHIGEQGNRFATVLTYLHEPEEGGATIFPNAHLEVRAKAGDSVLFWDLHSDNSPDENSLHGGKPVLKGTKWAMTKWIREQKASYRWEQYLTKEEKVQIKAEDEMFLKKKTFTLISKNQHQTEIEVIAFLLFQPKI